MLENVISQEQRELLRHMPVPLCVLYAREDSYQTLLLSQCLEEMIAPEDRPVPSGPVSLIDQVAPDDRKAVIDSFEYARVQPGHESHIFFRMRTGGTWTRTQCTSIAKGSEDGSYLIYVYLSCPQQDEIVQPAESTNGTASLLASDREAPCLSRWRIDITEDRTVTYERYLDRAPVIEPAVPYEEAARVFADQPHAEEDKRKLTLLLDRDALMDRCRQGQTAFGMEYRMDEDGSMPAWISIVLQTYISSATGRAECLISLYDSTEKILEKKLISRFTMLGYDVIGLLAVPSRKVRFFRLKPLQLGMDYDNDQDYSDSIENDLDRVIAPAQRKEVSQALRLETILTALQERSIYEYSFEVTTSDGRHRHKLLQYSYFDEQHDLLFLCRCDVTSQYQREHEQIEQLRAAKLAAEQASEAKSTFLASVSHDLRTPLNGIIGFTELALNEEDSRRKQEYIRKVRSSSALLLDLVNDTLELSRIESGKSVYAPEAVSLRAMSESVLTSLQPSAEIKSLQFVYDLHQCGDVVVWTDRIKFQKIFLNLLSNAIKYTPSGGKVTARVEWNGKDAKGYTCRLTVEDNGIGIREEFLPHIFDSFSQDRRPETAHIQGTGLGLSIVRRMVTMLHGEISVSSQVGQGTRFVVELPLTAADARQKSTAEDQTNVRLEGRRVLLCEDNPMNVEIATALLNSRKIQVESAANGKEGLEKLEQSALWYYDAILMDVRMPVMDGLEAARKIRSLDRADAQTIPIIAMTADAFEDDIQQCYEAGMNEHVTKPISPDRLFQALSIRIYEEDRIRQKGQSVQ